MPLSKHAAIVSDIHHRVNNNLQVLISILSLQARRTRHDEAAKVLQETQSRSAPLRACMIRFTARKTFLQFISEITSKH
jgi:two-component sensor histidine kinase